jgi:exonuclease III
MSASCTDSIKELHRYVEIPAWEEYCSSLKQGQKLSSQEKLLRYLRDHREIEPQMSRALSKFIENLRILQWNINGSEPRQREVLRKAAEDRSGIQVIALSEAFKRSETVKGECYDMVEQEPLDDTWEYRPTCFYTHKELHSDSKREVNFSCGCPHKGLHDQLIKTIRIETNLELPIYIHSVYNQRKLLPAECIAKRLELEGHHIMVGDFNLHHTEWCGPDMKQPTDTKATALLDKLQTHVRLITEPGTWTYRSGRSPDAGSVTLDLCWASNSISWRAHCTPADRFMDPSSLSADHRCMLTTVNVQTYSRLEDRFTKKLWKKADHRKVWKTCGSDLEVY